MGLENEFALEEAFELSELLNNSQNRLWFVYLPDIFKISCSVFLFDGDRELLSLPLLLFI